MIVGGREATVSRPAASERYLWVFQAVLAIKYGALGLEAVVRAVRSVLSDGVTQTASELGSLAWGAHYSAIAVAVALVLWLRRKRPAYAMGAMALVFVHAAVTMFHRGPVFANHHLLQALIGVFGMLAAGRQLYGDTARRAWGPMAWLVVAVWGLAGAKKLLHGSYHDGEFLAALADGSRRTLFALGSRVLLGESNGEPTVQGGCCFTGELDIPTHVGWVLVVASVSMALAEVSPVVVSFIASRATTGWLMLGLSVVATSIANEMDFGLVLIALAGLWGEGRAFRRVAVLVAIGMAGGHLWTFLR